MPLKKGHKPRFVPEGIATGHVFGPIDELFQGNKTPLSRNATLALGCSVASALKVVRTFAVHPVDAVSLTKAPALQAIQLIDIRSVRLGNRRKKEIIPSAAL